MIYKIFNADSTEKDRAEEFLCDEHAKKYSGEIQTLYRAIEINSSSKIIFRWLLQMKVAPYSYDLIDNLGRKSPTKLTPGLEKLEIGQKFMFIFDLVDYTENKEICLELNKFGKCLISYKILNNRLVVKLIVSHSKPLVKVKKCLLAAGDYIMMQKQLRTFKYLCERDCSE